MADSTEPALQNGLRVIVQPVGKTEIDIVCVHGLNPVNAPNHAYSTWTHENGKMWLKDFLPQEHPTARVMLFAYNANVAFETSTSGVNEQAVTLLNQLWLQRSEEDITTRPIIFIAHSLGGIIVKQALITGGHVKNKYKPIREAVFGIVFFATPHRGGGEFVPLGQLAAKIARAIHREPKNDFLANLERDNVFADDRIEAFRDQLESYKIVDRRSSNLGLPTAREDSLPLNLDHRSICKFSARDNEDYRTVAGNLRFMVRQAIREASSNAPALSGTSSPAPRQEPSPPPVQYESFLRGNPSPQPTPPLQIEATPYNEESPLALPPPQSESGLGIQRVATSIDEMSLAETERSLPLSDASEGSLHRQSTTTSITSGSTNANGKFTQQSPRLMSSLKMNVKNTDGLAFRDAAAKGKKDLVMKMLEEGQAIDNSGLWDGYTALADAARHGQTEIVELLLKMGANPAFNCLHSTSKFGSKNNTPLSLAAGHGHTNCVQVLLDFHQYDDKELNHAYRAAKYGKRSETVELVSRYGGGKY